jgi:hypothetical protein
MFECLCLWTAGLNMWNKPNKKIFSFWADIWIWISRMNQGRLSQLCHTAALKNLFIIWLHSNKFQNISLTLNVILDLTWHVLHYWFSFDCSRMAMIRPHASLICIRCCLEIFIKKNIFLWLLKRNDSLLLDTGPTPGHLSSGE